jgi:hypothetical protein
MSDAEIHEVRACRRDISAEFAHDVHRVLEYYRTTKYRSDGDKEGALSRTDISDWRDSSKAGALEQRN